MRVFLVALLLFVGVFHGVSFALDFRITEVISVGQVYGSGLTGPAQWSPDGTELAYFDDGQLMIADTLGNSVAVAQIDMPPHRFVWASNFEILLYQWEYLPRDSVDQNMRTIDRLILINLETGTQTILEEYVHTIGDRSKKINRSFKGPYLTFEGNAYYIIKEDGIQKRQMALTHLQKGTSLTENHVLAVGVDALFLVSIDNKDSIEVSDRPYRPTMGLWMRMHLSKDQTHLLNNGVIVRLEDDKTVVLDTIVRSLPKPEGATVCGSIQEFLNPMFPEVVFNLTCDDGHYVVLDQMAVFDYSTYELTILDSLIGLSNCTSPAYAPDGKRIAFLSDGALYILNRELCD